MSSGLSYRALDLTGIGGGTTPDSRHLQLMMLSIDYWESTVTSWTFCCRRSSYFRNHVFL